MSDDSGRAANQDSPAGPTGIPCASSLAMFSAPTAAAIPMTTLALAVANASVRRNVPGAGPPVHARAPEISAITKTTETAAYVSVMMLARRSEMTLSIAGHDSAIAAQPSINDFYEYNRCDFAPNPAASVPGATMKVEQRPADSKSKEALTDKATLLKLYREMLLIRRFEEKTAEMYQLAKIGGFCHLNIGEEATIVGTVSALRKEDYVYSNYREHGHAIAKGVDAKAIMAELFGKETGTSHGRGGSMHLFDHDR